MVMPEVVGALREGKSRASGSSSLLRERLGRKKGPASGNTAPGGQRSRRTARGFDGLTKVVNKRRGTLRKTSAELIEAKSKVVFCERRNVRKGSVEGARQTHVCKCLERKSEMLAGVGGERKRRDAHS